MSPVRAKRASRHSARAKPTKKSSFSSVHFHSDRQDWSTPQELFDRLNDEFDLIWDVCATTQNAKLPLYWTPEIDGLSADWRGKQVFCNPPYSQTAQWVEKCATSGAEVCVLLIPARTDTTYFHQHIYNNPRAEIRFIKGCLKFGDAQNSAPFPSMLVIFRNEQS